jgi:hypothetical protein
VVTSIDDLCRHRCRHRWRGKGETPSDRSQGSVSMSLSVSGGGKNDGGTGMRGRRSGGRAVKAVSASVLSRDLLEESPSGDAKVRQNRDCYQTTHDSLSLLY